MGLLGFGSDQIFWYIRDGKVCSNGNGFLLDVLDCRQNFGNATFSENLDYLESHLDSQMCQETVDIVVEALKDEEHLDIVRHE